MAEIENTFVDFAMAHPKRTQLGIVGLQILFRETKMRGWSYRGKIQAFRIKDMRKEDMEFKYRFFDSGEVLASSKIPMVLIYKRKKRKGGEGERR